MPGGTFSNGVSKVRPGTYINFVSKRKPNPLGAERGIVIIPLSVLGWGPNGKAIKLLASSPDAHMAELGHSVYDDNPHMLLLREAFKEAMTVIAYIINPGTQATATAGGLEIKATYGGTRGNDIAVACIAETESTFAVKVYLENNLVEEYNGLKTVADLIAASNKSYVTFSASATSAPLVAFASSALKGGTDGKQNNSDVSTFLDKSEIIEWNTMAFPITDPSLQTACISKIKYFRESVGKYVQAVLPNCASADYEGIINVTNSVVVDGKELTPSDVCAWYAAATAAADHKTSNTYKEYPGASDVVGIKTNEEAITALKNGEAFFSVVDNKVVIEQDINSLHTFTLEKTSDYAKNRVIRVYDSFAVTIRLNFPPNKFANENDGWLLMESLGKTLLRRFEDDKAITEVNYDEDFLVDREKSGGDETFFNIGIKAVDSAEKLYFLIGTR